MGHEYADEKSSKKKEKKNDDQRLTPEDKKYLNSKARVAKRIIVSIIEIAAITLLSIAITAYADGGIDKLMDIKDSLKDVFMPGGLVFNAVVSFLPIIILENIGIYFGIGTWQRMAIGIVRYAAFAVWMMYFITTAGATIDIPSTSGDVESITVSLTGLGKLAAFVMMVCVIIPIGEYIGARRKRAGALAKKERLNGSDD